MMGGFPRGLGTAAWTLVWVALAGAHSAASAQEAPPAEGTRVAVLPFTNLSGMAADNWVGTGIAESVAFEMERATPNTVIPLERVAAASSRDPREIGRALDANWVVAGAYQRQGDQLRITARVLDVRTGAVVGATTIDGAFNDLFDLQDRTAADLAAATSGAPDTTSVARATEGAITTTEGAVPARQVRRPPLQRPPPDSERRRGPGRAPAPEAGAGGFAAAPGVIDGPAAPVAPDVIRRDEQRRATIRATELPEGINLDGRLDEPVYQTIPAITGFIQQAPDEGAPATERTEAWIMFDDTNLYVAGRIWDTAPESEWVANEMRRDTHAPPERHLRDHPRHVL